MRHYMVDPDNGERLLKIPPNIVAVIKGEAYSAAREAILGAKGIDIAYGRGLDEPAQFIWLNHALEAIDALKEDK